MSFNSYNWRMSCFNNTPILIACVRHKWITIGLPQTIAPNHTKSFHVCKFMMSVSFLAAAMSNQRPGMMSTTKQRGIDLEPLESETMQILRWDELDRSCVQRPTAEWYVSSNLLMYI